MNDILKSQLLELGISEFLTNYAVGSRQTTRTCIIILEGSFEGERSSATWNPKTAVELYLDTHSRAM